MTNYVLVLLLLKFKKLFCFYCLQIKLIDYYLFVIRIFVIRLICIRLIMEFQIAAANYTQCCEVEYVTIKTNYFSPLS